MKIVAISDTHCRFNEINIPECDVLISAGDYSFHGTNEEVQKFHSWLNKQPAKHIISLQGNHEVGVEKNFNLAKRLALEACPKVHFLDEGLVEIEGIKIWCSSVTPFFCNWAWNRHRGEDIKKYWDKIPEDTNILVTHGPPFGILDSIVDRNGKPTGETVGCQDLLNKVRELKHLKYHIYGHIHNGYGYLPVGNTIFINASICTERYEARNAPFVIEYDKTIQPHF